MGFFLKLASQLYDVYGVEISANAVTDCHRRGLNQVYPGMLTPEVMNDIGQYDILVMLDVIEHLENPKNVLEIATSQLKSGGIFILTTGDYSSMLARIFKSNWRLMTPPQHMWFFSVEGIQKLAKSLGFEVISISHPWKFVPLSLIFYQIMRILGFQPRNYKFISNKLFMPINMFDAMQVILYKK